MRNRKKYILSALTMALVLLVISVPLWMMWCTKKDMRSINDAPQWDVAIILGAKIYKNQFPSPMLADRISRGVQLYRAGKVKKLLMSGDNGEISHNEPQVMKRWAALLGVPEKDIILDYAGFRTFDTCYRARAVFNLSHAIIVTQKFHMARTLYTCQRLGLTAIGVIADQQEYSGMLFLWAREQGARWLAWWDIYLNKTEPRFLGPEEKIN